MLKYHIMNEEEKKIICDWKYEKEYEIYNLESYEAMKEKKSGLANPAHVNNFYSFYDDQQLVGFANILEEEKEVFIGLGVNPLYCNQGYGTEILHYVSKIAKSLYKEKPLYLEVRSWNKRAIRCYEKAGFVIDGNSFEQVSGIGKGEFYRMVKEI